ncbi:unnamed protein product [Miscanthus lutarioriparius]|uniref:LisH domain-containing protein n=1 Tax=Miscanthus lutarioriparius TaxID=422564 RepID=A0A811QIN5_9POAL|nr:unnamed protein product [Miscanthus lutarioriparius]
MDDYAREMMELKTLVTRTLEKKGVLAKIRAELRASVFEAIEEEDRVVENDDGGNPALLGSCNDRAKQLHASPSGRLLTALVCEYLEWAQLSHTMKVYLPECNLPKDFWKNELKDFSNKSGAEGSRSAESGPMLLDVLEGYLKYENLSQTRMGGRRMMSSESDPSLNVEHRSMRRPPSASVGSLPPMGRYLDVSVTYSTLKLPGQSLRCRHQIAEGDLQLPITQGKMSTTGDTMPMIYLKRCCGHRLR